MSIVKVNKFSLFVMESDRDRLIHELQKFKYVHFCNLNQEQELLDMGLDSAAIPEKLSEVQEETSKVKYIINSLSKYDERPKGLMALKNGKPVMDFNELEEKALKIDYNPLYESIKKLNDKIDYLQRKAEKINERITELAPWLQLDVSIEELAALNSAVVLTGTIPKRYQENLETAMLDTTYTYYEIISSQGNMLYIFALCLKEELAKTEGILRNYGFSPAVPGKKELPAMEVKMAREQLEKTKNEIRKLEEELKKNADRLPDMELLYDYLLNKQLRVAASENFVKIGSVDVIEGYIPADMTESFRDIITKNSSVYYLDIKEAEKDDINTPILLKNSSITRAFESLTRMYSLPRYNEIDPTPLLSAFHILFFGMMIADLGYGLIMFLGTLAALVFFRLSESQKNTMRFFMFGSITTMFWGLIYGSFFSGLIPLPVIIDPATQFYELLALSIALGIFHIFFALAVKAYMQIRDGNLLGALFDVGFWYMALGGAIAYLLMANGIIPGKFSNIALGIMIAGMAGIVLTNGREAKTLGGKLASGLYSLYGITSYIGDFISYSRLMALGLSGAFIASAVNMMVGMLMKQGIVGIIGGILVFIVGQLFNAFFGVIGSYVHSIRLTYVEFFGKFYEGGGKPFKPLQSETKYIELK